MDIKLKTSTSWWTIVLCLSVGLVAGFFAGRHTVEKGEKVTYIREASVTGVAGPLEPVSVEVPTSPALPVRTDTVYVDRVMYTREVVDTAAIIADYELKRSYTAQLFDNQYGKLSLSLSTQYNRLGNLSYEFTPVTKIIYRERAWRPFATATYNTLGYGSVGVGLSYKSIGIGFEYVTDFKRHGVGIAVNRFF
jgi:hypothetical protein